MKNENSWGFVDATNISIAFKKTGYLSQNIYIKRIGLLSTFLLEMSSKIPEKKKMEFL